MTKWIELKRSIYVNYFKGDRVLLFVQVISLYVVLIYKYVGTYC